MVQPSTDQGIADALSRVRDLAGGSRRASAKGRCNKLLRVLNGTWLCGLRCIDDMFMRRLFITGISTAIAGSLTFTPAYSRAESWTVYRDRVHDCRLEYPTSLFTQQPLDMANKAQRFSGPDSRTYFRVMGVENKENLTPAGVKTKYLRANVPGDLVYERTERSFLVLSGYRTGSIFYTKVAMSANQRSVCILEITYPRKTKRAFDHIVTRMSRSFVFAN